MSDYSGPASGEDFDPEVEMTPEARPDSGKQSGKASPAEPADTDSNQDDGDQDAG